MRWYQSTQAQQEGEIIFIKLINGREGGWMGWRTRIRTSSYNIGLCALWLSFCQLANSQEGDGAMLTSCHMCYLLTDGCRHGRNPFSAAARCRTKKNVLIVFLTRIGQYYGRNENLPLLLKCASIWLLNLGLWHRLKEWRSKHCTELYLTEEMKNHCKKIKKLVAKISCNFFAVPSSPLAIASVVVKHCFPA